MTPKITNSRIIYFSISPPFPPLEPEGANGKLKLRKAQVAEIQRCRNPKVSEPKGVGTQTQISSCWKSQKSSKKYWNMSGDLN